MTPFDGCCGSSVSPKPKPTIVISFIIPLSRMIRLGWTAVNFGLPVTPSNGSGSETPPSVLVNRTRQGPLRVPRPHTAGDPHGPDAFLVTPCTPPRLTCNDQCEVDV